mmetsp:Transcript_118191/g.235441  ORF Transcript_118191/g.235441 Transcript_118191/m.235441 type:complete len:85 (+) Transcript_118191:165-419(+)
MFISPALSSFKFPPVRRPQQPQPGVLPAGKEPSITQQQHLLVTSKQPSSQQPPVSVFVHKQQTFPSCLQHGSLPPGELQPYMQQ